MGGRDAFRFSLWRENPPFSILQIIESMAQKTPEHVPLYYIIGAGWAQLVGWSQVPLRYFSLLFGVLTIAWVFRFGEDLFDRRTALLAAFLCGSSAIVIIYFHELRNYTIWMCMCVAHAWHYWRLASGARAGSASWIVFVATTSALLYVHAFSAFVFFGLGLLHLFLVARNRRWFNIVFAWGAGLLTFVPYAMVLALGLADASSSVRSKAATSLELVPMLANVFTNGVEWIWIVLIVAGGWTLWRKRTRQAQRLLLFIVGIVLALFVFHEFFPFLSATRLRYFLVALTFALILFAHFLMSIPRIGGFWFRCL